MSYRFEKKETISDGVQRITSEEIHFVIAELNSVPLQSENIHEARRHLKKVRALLRLVRKRFPSALFKKERETFRVAGKMLSPIRDVRVISKALVSLKGSAGKINPGFLFLTAVLQTDCDRREMGKTELSGITKLLRAALGRVENRPLAKPGCSEIRAAMERSFLRCKKSFRKSIETEKNEAFHEWRKRVKDLEYHLRLFEKAWRKNTKCSWGKIKRLDDLLGEDHDLVLLTEKLRGFKFQSGELQNGYQKIVTAICKRRAKLQQRAMKIGKETFKERPGIFVRRNVRL
jgi:CHAD domain-containing protein